MHFAAIFVIFADTFAQLGVLHAAHKIHNILLHCVLRYPVRFFDTVPLGRIVSRFSSDIHTLDDDLGFDLNQVLNELFEV